MPLRRQKAPGRRRQDQFASVPQIQAPRSVLNRSFGLKTAFESGLLIPIYADEALPGDTFNLSCTAFIRLAVPVVPVMDNMYADFFFFAVPKRILWDNWVHMMGERKNPNDSIDFRTPIINETVATESLSDYLGLPITSTDISFNAFWHRAYNLIWNEWFRDQNLQDSVAVPTGDGPDDPSLYVLKRRGKRHDYFTSCLPFAQKGDPVGVPIGTTAPVTGNLPVKGDGAHPTFDLGGTTGAALSHVDAQANTQWDRAISGTGNLAKWRTTSLFGDASDPQATLVADLSQATFQTINSIREAFQIQKFLERDARAGTRYTELIRSHFNVSSDDGRLQRPEYLGGGSAAINITPIHASTSVAGVEEPLGSLGGVGAAFWDGRGFVKSFTEHCVVLGLVSVRADLTYQQGLPRMFSRRDRLDYYWPSFAHLGEQPVLSKEIYCDGGGLDDSTWGYQERFAEYRYKPSQVTGKLRSTATVPLDVWHLGLNFSSRPNLNEAFIEDKPPIDRLQTVPGEPQFKGDFAFRYICARPMPTRSVPGLVDHF